MELFCYQSSVNISSSTSIHLAWHLWHFSNVFQVVQFKINDVSVSNISFENISVQTFVDILKENEPNHFEISIFDSNKDYILKLIDVLHLSLIDELVPSQLSFDFLK